MKCHKVGAEGLCSDVSWSHGRGGGSRCLRGGNSHLRAGETRAPPVLLEGELVLRGLYFSLGSLKRTQLTPPANTNTSRFCHPSGSSPCKQAGGAKGLRGSKCHTPVQAATSPTSGMSFFNLQKTGSSPHTLGLLT